MHVVSKAFAVAGLAFAVACAPSRKRASPDAPPPIPTRCEDISARYQELVDTTPCHDASECSEPHSGTLECYNGPHLVNGASPGAARLRELEAAFGKSCTALPCTPATGGFITRCEQSVCKTRYEVPRPR